MTNTSIGLGLGLGFICSYSLFVVKSDDCVGRIQCVAICLSVLHNQLEALDPIHLIWFCNLGLST